MIKVQVLLSSYNGGKFIHRMLDSILAQDYKFFSILVRDDGSKDNTVEILKSYESQLSNVKLVEGDNVGVIDSFNILVASRDLSCDLFMFCDQDDFWFSNKISNFVAKYEMSVKPIEPFLCVADLITTDVNLKIISESFWRERRFNPNDYRYEGLFFENHFPGCNMSFNSTFLSILDRMPPCYAFLMHDIYFIHNALALDCLYFIDSPQMFYIQHENNVIGAKKSFLGSHISTYLTTSYYHSTYSKWLSVCLYVNSRFTSNNRVKFLSVFGKKFLPISYFKLTRRISSIKFYFVYSVGYIISLIKLKFKRFLGH
ncbi:glycosyltransferase [Shewanella xiamenensis]|uniref:glycosyltransferase n=1 Tax=Shewanella xiamenensis TaxID=332186 RepID=UPI00166B6E40|nr:glycosyltransferase [Shewanella xiamenensis]MCL1071886.1 glycosyltransferase [Shewanella xiamenensis]GGM97894.1 hypothetical protein GCM10009124_28550 [Shewanella xiamenensis]